MALLPLTQGIHLTGYSIISIWVPACHPLARTHFTLLLCNTLHTNINTSCLASYPHIFVMAGVQKRPKMSVKARKKRESSQARDQIAVFLLDGAGQATKVL